ANFHLCLLELVDLPVDAVQRGFVGRAEVAAARDVRHRLEQFLVDVDGQVRVLVTAEQAAGDRDRGDALRADADRVDLDVERGGRLRGGQRVDLATVVLAIGHQDDDARLAGRATQPVGGGGDRGADGGAVL